MHLLESRLRGLPAWNGFVLPTLALAFEEGAVLAARADLVPRLREALGSDLALPRVDLPALRRLRRAMAAVLPHAFTLAGECRAVDAGLFRPVSGGDAEPIPRDDPAARPLLRRFDGAIFGVRGPRDKLVSWAALKRKSETVWEVATATEPDYRGRGYARQAVSAATASALEQGRVPLYIFDADNRTSAFVCRVLGYQRYADIAFAEF